MSYTTPIPVLSKNIEPDKHAYEEILDRYKGIFITREQLKQLTYNLELAENALNGKKSVYDTLPDGESKRSLFNIIAHDKAYIKALTETLERCTKPVEQVSDLEPIIEAPKPKTKTCKLYNVQEVIQRMSKPQFSIERFNELRNDKPKAIAYLLSCGVYWQRCDNQNIDWMRAVMSVNALSKNY